MEHFRYSKPNRQKPFGRSRQRSWLMSFVVAMVVIGTATSQEQDPLTMNGGSVLAMAGKECVALAVDKRFASGNQMVNIAPRHVYVPSPQLMVAFAGMEGDVQSLSQALQDQVSSKLGRGLGFMQEERRRRPVITPRAMASLTSHVLYNRRQAPYYVEPMVVGLTEELSSDRSVENLAGDLASEGKDASGENQEGGVTTQTGAGKSLRYRPYLCVMDCIGAKSVSQAFVCAGAASDSLYGTAEAMWKPDLSQDELVEVCARSFLSALERDCLSGYGAILYLITRDGVMKYELASRND